MRRLSGVAADACDGRCRGRSESSSAQPWAGSLQLLLFRLWGENGSKAALNAGQLCCDFSQKSFFRSIENPSEHFVG
ncbi:hypothetical protein Y1Q_0019188 [Alligator mississippiensis]|uniref:Uncharacterized protein n=1 Tax=Alligator mississippiensis TaxID=8496 RepID=A0A151MQA1_ALLMI|nr:hypothetical protein Y1Q_0019188 [Alligator mississippiensis]